MKKGGGGILQSIARSGRQTDAAQAACLVNSTPHSIRPTVSETSPHLIGGGPHAPQCPQPWACHRRWFPPNPLTRGQQQTLASGQARELYTSVAELSHPHGRQDWHGIPISTALCRGWSSLANGQKTTWSARVGSAASAAASP